MTTDEKLAIRGAVAAKDYNPASQRTKKAEQIVKDKLAGGETPIKEVLPLSIKTVLDGNVELPKQVKEFFEKNSIDIKNLRGSLAAHAVVAAFKLLDMPRPDMSGVDYVAKITGEYAAEKKDINFKVDPEDAKELEQGILEVIGK